MVNSEMNNEEVIYWSFDIWRKLANSKQFSVHVSLHRMHRLTWVDIFLACALSPLFTENGLVVYKSAHITQVISKMKLTQILNLVLQQ